MKIIIISKFHIRVIFQSTSVSLDDDYRVGHSLYDVIMYQNCLLRYQNCLLRHQNLSSGPPSIENGQMMHQITNHRPQKFKKWPTRFSKCMPPSQTFVAWATVFEKTDRATRSAKKQVGPLKNGSHWSHVRYIGECAVLVTIT